jgi:hypothetical protein
MLRAAVKDVMNEEYVPEHILTGDIVGRRPDVKASR